MIHLGSVGVDILLIVIGFLAGTLGSLVGLGGGFIMVPLTSVFLALPSRIVAGTSTAVIVVNSLASVRAYAQQRRIDIRSGLWFALFAVPGSFVGSYFSHDLSTHVFNLIFGIFLICASVFLVIKPKEAKRMFFKATSHRTFTDKSGKTYDYRFNLPIGLTAAFLVGFLSSLFGIGGGTVMVPVMVLLLGFPPHVAAATSMLMVLGSSVVGTVSHALLGDVAWAYALFLAIGAIAGGWVGPRLSAKVNAVWLLRILAVLMILTSFRMMFS